MTKDRTLIFRCDLKCEEKAMYQKHKMNIIGFDDQDVFTDGVWIGSQEVGEDDERPASDG